MSTTSSTSGATSSNAYSTGSALTSLNGSSTMQITGLASGLDTNSIIEALMSNETQQVTNLQNQQTGLTAMNTQLTSIQSALQKVANDAQSLGDPSLFADTQSITSTDSTLVGATATGSNGAVVGSYQVSVSALASASQRTFTFTSPTSADTITIDGHDTNIAAGASAQDLANAINNDQNATVWATVTGTDQSSGKPQIVLSERNTGAPPASDPTGYVTVTGDAAGALSEQTQYATAGTNAAYTINGEPTTQYSTSNTISGAAVANPNSATPGASQTIPGVTLSLNGLTGSNPVTVNVGSPAPSQQNISTAVQQFVTDYNSAITQIQTQLSQTPSSSDPTQGTLYADSDLQQLLYTMRDQLVASVGGLSGSMSNMLDLGVSTGATTGSGSVSQSALAGDLTLDSTTLTNALTNNASGAKSVLQSFSIEFSNLVNNEAAPGGTIDTRIANDNSQSSYLSTEISNMQSANTIKQNELVQEFADMESALSSAQSTSNWLTQQSTSGL